MLDTTRVETTTDYLPQGLQQEVSRCLANHNVLHVKQPEGESFMVISVEDWEDIEETLFLSRIPGLAESVNEAYQDILDGNGVPLKELEL
jgi:PHD/YefM family antitoxin component YafN of YafNO toxin-antitoxin module